MGHIGKIKFNFIISSKCLAFGPYNRFIIMIMIVYLRILANNSLNNHREFAIENIDICYLFSETSFSFFISFIFVKFIISCQNINII